MTGGPVRVVAAIAFGFGVTACGGGSGAPTPPPNGMHSSSGGPGTPAHTHDARERADGHRRAAMRRLQERNGAGCVAELDAADRIDPNPERRSSNPRGLLTVRATCEMLAGQCELGKQRFRETLKYRMYVSTPKLDDQTVSGMVGRYCGAGAVTISDKIAVAEFGVREGERLEQWKRCVDSHRQLELLLSQFRPVTAFEQRQKEVAERLPGLAASCAGSANLCPEARRLDALAIARSSKRPPDPATLERGFLARHPRCRPR